MTSDREICVVFFINHHGIKTGCAVCGERMDLRTGMQAGLSYSEPICDECLRHYDPELAAESGYLEIDPAEVDEHRRAGSRLVCIDGQLQERSAQVE
jgi:hypothetical protein